MKRIAYFIGTFPKLSETFVSREVLLLQKKGISPVLFAGQPPSKEERLKLPESIRSLIDQTRYLSATAAIRCLLENPGLGFRFLNQARQIASEATNSPNPVVLLGRSICLGKACRKQGIQHIHAHWPYASLVAWLTHEIFGIPFSISVHAHEVFHENGHFKRVLPAIQYAAFCNEAAKEALIKKFPLYEQKTYLIYHGVNLENFPALSMPAFEGKSFKIISAGRLTPTKGFDRLIRACARARREGIPVELTILGEGGIKEDLLNLAREEDFLSHLNLPGWVGHEEVVSYFKSSHLFVLLANVNYHDGLPNVVLEAMATARPVIISPLPAAGEAVKHTKNGFILQAVDDYEGFINFLKILADQPELLEKLGRSARRTVELDFSDAIHIEKMIELFNKTEIPATA